MNAANATWRMARAALRADRGGFAGTFVALLLAAALLSATGVVVESGLRQPDQSGSGLLLALAGSFSGTAAAVVVLVVTSTVSLAVRRRRREFALLRAVGATARQVRGMLTAEVVLVTAAAAPVGMVPGLVGAHLLRPLLLAGGVVGPGFRVLVSPLPALGAAAVLLPLALVAALLAARETLRTPPTAAVREVGAESSPVGAARRVAAACLAVLGASVVLVPVVVPGTVGASSAATSAFLLVGAAALAGPVLVDRVLGRTSALLGRARGAGTRLALMNTRGFSRRLTAAIVPLAVAVAAGTVQTGVDRAVAQAARQELTRGLNAQLVVTPRPAEHLLTAQQVAAVAGTPGVRAVTPLGTVSARVRTDSSDPQLLDGLSFEPAQLRVLPDSSGPAAVDPGVLSGSLADLGGSDTVAVSNDALLGSSRRVGDQIDIRLGNRVQKQVRVVAVYARGLGFGDYLVGAGTAQALGAKADADTVLVGTDPAAAADVAQRLTGTALQVQRVDDYVAAVSTEGARGQHLSAVLLVALLGFVLLSAANTLVMTTAGRRAELRLLRRTGAGRRQLLAMAATESLVTAGAAWSIGTLAAAPAVLGVAYGLLGRVALVVDLRTYVLLSVAVLGIAVLTIVPTVARGLRGTLLAPETA